MTEFVHPCLQFVIEGVTNFVHLCLLFVTEFVTEFMIEFVIAFVHPCWQSVRAFCTILYCE